MIVPSFHFHFHFHFDSEYELTSQFTFLRTYFSKYMYFTRHASVNPPA